MVLNENLEEGQIVLCTVEKIVGTTVFVSILGGGEGTITTSEISPGRIRNLRDYVVPGKKIVCKILKKIGENVYLSLRRVKPSEKKELLDTIKKEKSYIAILSTVLGKDKAKPLKNEILKNNTITEFFDNIKDNTKTLEKLTSKTDTEKIIKILDSKKEKLKSIKQIFKLTSKTNDGVNKIKNILTSSCKGTRCKINYVAAGKYSMTLKGENFKELKSTNNQVLDSIEKLAKKEGCDFSKDN